MFYQKKIQWLFLILQTILLIFLYKPFVKSWNNHKNKKKQSSIICHKKTRGIKKRNHKTLYLITQKALNRARKFRKKINLIAAYKSIKKMNLKKQKI